MKYLNIHKKKHNFHAVKKILEQSSVTPMAILDSDESIIWSNESMNALIDITASSNSWDFHLKNSFQQTKGTDPFPGKLLSKVKAKGLWDVKVAPFEDGRLIQLIDISEYIQNTQLPETHNLGDLVDNTLEALALYLLANEIIVRINPSPTYLRINPKDFSLALSTLLSGSGIIFQGKTLNLSYKQAGSHINISLLTENITEKWYQEAKERLKEDVIHYFGRVENILKKYSPEINIVKLNELGQTSLRIDLEFINIECETTQEQTPPLPSLPADA